MHTHTHTHTHTDPLVILPVYRASTTTDFARLAISCGLHPLAQEVIMTRALSRNVYKDGIAIVELTVIHTAFPFYIQYNALKLPWMPRSARWYSKIHRCTTTTSFNCIQLSYSNHCSSCIGGSCWVRYATQAWQLQLASSRRWRRRFCVRPWCIVIPSSLGFSANLNLPRQRSLSRGRSGRPRLP